MEEKDTPDFFENNGQQDASAQSDENFEQAKGRLNFDISSENSDIMQDTVPYDFRAENKVVSDDEDFVKDNEKHLLSIRFHAIGIGILIGVLLAVLISVFLFGKDDNDDKNQQPIVVSESTRPIKVRPTMPGGMEISDQDKTIYKKMRSDDVSIQAKVVSIPEEEPVQPQVKTKEGGILGAPQMASPQEMEWEVLNLKDKQESEKNSAQVLVQNKDIIEEKVMVKTEIEQPETVQPEPIQQREKAQPVVVEKKKKEPVKEVQKAATQSKKTTSKKQEVWHVQLSSLQSRAAANKELPRILKAHSNLLSGLPNQIKEVNVKGKTFYRLMVGEFKSKKDAENLCTKLKNRKQDCTIAK